MERLFAGYGKASPVKVVRYENGRRLILDNVRVPERVLKYLGLPVEIYLRHLPP